MGLSDQAVDRISGILGVVIVGVFVLGLAWSISHGFAGFWGGFPFWVIALVVLAMIIYDFWSTLIGSKKN
jgi:hypothetical protein